MFRKGSVRDDEKIEYQPKSVEDPSFEHIVAFVEQYMVFFCFTQTKFGNISAKQDDYDKFDEYRNTNNKNMFRESCVVALMDKSFGDFF